MIRIAIVMLIAAIFTSACKPNVSTSEKTKSNSNAELPKPDIPEFTLACSYNGGIKGYRIASKNGIIFSASIVNLNNKKAAKKSISSKVSSHEITAEMQSGEGDQEELSIDRTTLNATTKRYVSKSLYPPDGFNTLLFECTPVDEPQTFDDLKSSYESTLADTQEKRRMYENRPNKI